MTTTIHHEVLFKTSPSKLYETLTNSQQFSAVTGGAPTEISQEVGGSFKLFGGYIEGRHIELVPSKRIVQAWRPANWEEGLFSIVKFELKEHHEGTLLIFDHTGVPEDQIAHLDTGWGENYWKPLEKFLG
ncbi:SRPBCC domain-containing protein [Bacillus sp. CGMCC 1.16607]|uniref:SRPBCC domain-containing protein n=1 Tax=Bacillus sp. CGMCC 1.16607 TaxID=3351842 RepID=UPI0036453979